MVALQNKHLLCRTSNIAQVDFDVDFNIDQYFAIDFNMTISNFSGGLCDFLYLICQNLQFFLLILYNILIL